MSFLSIFHSRQSSLSRLAALVREHPTPSFHSTRFSPLDDLAMEGVHR
jgi:hypothetical protein